jgi:hypothetical protein
MEIDERFHHREDDDFGESIVCQKKHVEVKVEVKGFFGIWNPKP